MGVIDEVMYLILTFISSASMQVKTIAMFVGNWCNISECIFNVQLDMHEKDLSQRKIR